MSQVIIVGGGLAGLAAATALAPRGFKVTILESRNRLGGRASSFLDPTTQQLIDACQHVSMGCCTNWKHFCQTVGIAKYLERQPVLYFMTPDRRVSRFAADPWPAPFHLGRALMCAHYLSAGEKLRIIWGLLHMQLADPEADPPLLPWLIEHRQTERTIQRYWGIVLTSALNETVERVGLKYARKVFIEGFMQHREGFVVEVPSVPLGRLYGEELRSWCNSHQVEIRENAGVVELIRNDQGRITHVKLRDGTAVLGDHFILAVPFERVADLFPDASSVESLKKLSPSPITSVHLWYDRPVLTLPHVVLIDCLGQWVFSRGETSPGEHYVQVVVSASRELRELGREEVQQQIAAEMNRLFPMAREAKLLRTRVVTEHSATFSAIPGVDAFRPIQKTNVANLYLAGDYTRTGWPATMEGAVRSGYLAAEALQETLGRGERLIQPDL